MLRIRLRWVSSGMLLLGVILLGVGGVRYAYAAEKKCRIAGVDACAVSSYCSAIHEWCYYCQPHIYRTCSGIPHDCDLDDPPAQCGDRLKSRCDRMYVCLEVWEPDTVQCQYSGLSTYPTCPMGT